MHLWCVEDHHQALCYVWCIVSRSRSPHVHPTELRRHPQLELAARHPRPVADDDLAELADYADPDCGRCAGAGAVGSMPCDDCIVGVWL